MASPPRLTITQMLRSVQPRAFMNLIVLNIQTILSTFADNIGDGIYNSGQL